MSVNFILTFDQFTSFINLIYFFFFHRHHHHHWKEKILVGLKANKMVKRVCKRQTSKTPAQMTSRKLIIRH